MQSNNDEMREAFEKRYRISAGFNSATGQYHDPEVQGMWEVWQACWQSRASITPPIVAAGEPPHYPASAVTSGTPITPPQKTVGEEELAKIITDEYARSEYHRAYRLDQDDEHNHEVAIAWIAKAILALQAKSDGRE